MNVVNRKRIVSQTAKRKVRTWRLRKTSRHVRGRRLACLTNTMIQRWDFELSYTRLSTTISRPFGLATCSYSSTCSAKKQYCNAPVSPVLLYPTPTLTQRFFSSDFRFLLLPYPLECFNRLTQSWWRLIQLHRRPPPPIVVRREHQPSRIFLLFALLDFGRAFCCDSDASPSHSYCRLARNKK